MRVAVIGATGNAGTAVLRVLHDTPEVKEIVGVARRLPDTAVEPYAGCHWQSLDVADSENPEATQAALVELLRGMDAVIHLAWLIQPNEDREMLRQVNVEGTRRVAQAVAAAGVPHLVVACSVGAYSPDEARGQEGVPPLRDERWPTGGIQSSHYSVDKVAQERALDAFAAEHPDIKVTRLRPALIFQDDAASEIQRYFLGLPAPVQALRAGKLPILPLPKGLLLQAVHADDVARAYVAAVVRRVGGAFNICADDLLGPQELSEVVDHGRFTEVPVPVVRAALKAGHKAGAVPADEGWLDMGMQVPMMDNARAKRELDWQPRHTAAEALRELLEGMAVGEGGASSPLKPRGPEDATVPGVHEPAHRGAAAGRGDRERAGAPDEESRELLNIYLADHLAGATAGSSRMARMADAYIDTPMYAQLSSLSTELRAERAFLRQLIRDLELKPLRYRRAIAWAGEHMGRLKGNGRVVRRSPLTMLIEAELMRAAVLGKLGLWQTLQDHAGTLGLDAGVFSRLADVARRQISTLDEVHAYARARALGEAHEAPPA